MLSSTSLSSSFLPCKNLNISPISRSPISSRTRFLPPCAASATATRHRATGSCTTSLYEILGIPIEANNKEIKTAYRRLARICHPDVAAAEDRVESSAADNFIKLHEAYSTLSDPEKRADYDGKLLWRRSSRPLTSVKSGFSCYGRKNWESDQCW